MASFARLRSLVSFPTSIGRVPRSEKGRRRLVAGIALFTLAMDAWMIKSGRYADYSWRALLAVVAIALAWFACRWDIPSLGLTGRTTQGARWWWKGTLMVAAVMGTLLLVLTGILLLTGNFQPYQLHPSLFGERVVHACLWAPFVEEAIYRVVLVVPLAAALRTSHVIWIAGAVFAGLHVYYGNPAPDNLIGGFFMTWAYLKSGSIVVPLLYHSAGNLFVLGTQVLAYHLF